MKALTRGDIVSGLRELGVQAGDRVLVHCSMAALGRVEGGADAAIDALLEAVGAQGLVVVPTFACPAPFDRRTSPTPLGAVPERLWQRPGAVRSKHPTHSVAAIGAGAQDLIRDHEKAPTAYAEGTPYYRLAMGGGKILLLGVDQDRNTTLHAAEALAGSPYLQTITATYVDDDGSQVAIPVAAMAGPHRDFLGLDPLFRRRGIMRVGRIGQAVCRLMDGKAMIDTALEALREDPAAVLCDNPACADCVMQRGRIKAARLAGEEFTLAAVAGDISEDPDEVLAAIQGEGIAAVELTREEYRRYGAQLAAAGVRIAAIRGHQEGVQAASLAGDLGVPLVVPVASREALDASLRLREKVATVLIENAGARSSLYREFYSIFTDGPGLAFNPAQFAAAGEKPFLQVFYRGVLPRQTVHFYVEDGTSDGRPALPGQGNGEVKEIVSMLRCRGYQGVMTLRSHERGIPAFRQAAAAFWKLLETM